MSREAVVAALRANVKAANIFYGTDLDERGRRSYGVAGSTFRAYCHYATRPSVVFRAWAANFLPRAVHLIVDANTCRQMHADALKELDAVLRPHAPNNVVEFYKIAKLVDLLNKHVVQRQDISAQSRQIIRTEANIALDKWTLRLIRCAGYNIPPSASMSWVSTRVLYDNLQIFVRVLTREAGV